MTTMPSANRSRASIVDLTFITWAVAVPLVLQSRLLNADGDFARHARMGEFILLGGPWQIDDLSWIKTGPFLTTEWLSQVAFALAHRVGGIAGIAVLCGLLIGLTYALVVHQLLQEGVEAFLAYAAATFAAVVGSPHWLARPHIFTFLALAILVLCARRNSSWWSYAILFAVWANFHAGFVVGLAILLSMAAGEWLESLQSKGAVSEILRRNARRHVTGFAVGLLASLANPQGIGLLRRIAGVLSNDFLLSQTAEFQSIDFHSAYGQVFLLAILGIVALVALRRRPLSFASLLVLLLMLAAGLISRRNIALFALVAFPLLAVEFDPEWRALRISGLQRVRRVFEEGERLARPGRWAPAFGVLLLLLGMNHGSIAGTRLIVADFDAGVFPVEAVRTAREARLEGRIFSHETWGGYMLYAWPDQKIFMDGMTDFFGADLMRSYLRMMRLDPGWEAEFNGYGIDMVLLQPHTRLANALREQYGWRVWYEDATAILLLEPGNEEAVAAR